MIALAVPVWVPDSTRRAPSVVVRMLAVTPGLLGALLIAEAMPASVLSVPSIAMLAEVPPTVMSSVPVPTAVVALAKAAVDRLAAVARFCTDKE